MPEDDKLQLSNREGSAPIEVVEVFKRLEIETEDARNYFRRLHSQFVTTPVAYQLKTWLSNNTQPLNSNGHDA